LDERKRPLSAEEVLRGLQDGGFDFDAQGWKLEKNRLRALAISLSKNSAIFTKLPNGLFGLAKWYPGAKRPKAKDEDEATAGNGGPAAGDADVGDVGEEQEQGT
jgi:hypothetical protein